MVNSGGYEQRKVLMAKAVMAEVFRALGEYRQHMVLVGGWVPGMLMRGAAERHVGSLDVDIALDHMAIGEECYTKISEVLARLGFSPDPATRFRFWRDVADGAGKFRVYLDLLAAEYGGRGASHRHQHVQDVEARKARGCDLAMGHSVAVTIEMVLPDGAMARVDLRVAGVAAFIVMKAFAIRGRRKDKDAYDVVYCMRHFPGGVPGVAAEFAEIAKHGLTVEALGILEADFSTPRHIGPVGVASFLGVDEAEERAIVCRGACELVRELVALVRR